LSILPITRASVFRELQGRHNRVSLDLGERHRRDRAELLAIHDDPGLAIQRPAQQRQQAGGVRVGSAAALRAASKWRMERDGIISLCGEMQGRSGALSRRSPAPGYFPIRANTSSVFAARMKSF
jgi:hypothetical protein